MKKNLLLTFLFFVVLAAGNILYAIGMTPEPLRTAFLVIWIGVVPIGTIIVKVLEKVAEIRAHTPRPARASVTPPIRLDTPPRRKAAPRGRVAVEFAEPTKRGVRTI